MRKSFVKTYLEIAKKLAEDRSSDFFTKVAAVAINNRNEIIACSYNGTKPGYAFSFDESLENNRDKKNLLYFHAEENIIMRCQRDEINSLFLSHSPCRNCAKLIAGFGIKNVYYIEEYHRDQDFKFIFKEYDVNYEHIKI